MFIEVVFPLPFRNTFTYLVPKELEPAAKFGVRVLAPFGKRYITGFIIGQAKNSQEIEKIKQIIDVIDSIPLISESSFKFYQWMSEYYLSSLGEALKLSAPYGTDVE